MTLLLWNIPCTLTVCLLGEGFYVSLCTSGYTSPLSLFIHRIPTAVFYPVDFCSLSLCTCIQYTNRHIMHKWPDGEMGFSYLLPEGNISKLCHLLGSCLNAKTLRASFFSSKLLQYYLYIYFTMVMMSSGLLALDGDLSCCSLVNCYADIWPWVSLYNLRCCTPCVLCLLASRASVGHNHFISQGCCENKFIHVCEAFSY